MKYYTLNAITSANDYSYTHKAFSISMVPKIRYDQWKQLNPNVNHLSIGVFQAIN